jgi:hypothetical protein
VVDLGGGVYGGGYAAPGGGYAYGSRGERGGDAREGGGGGGGRDGDGEIVWARWDGVRVPGKEERRLLLVGYARALQVWDCSALDAVEEVLSVRVGGGEEGEWKEAGRVVHAAVLPALGGEPLLGVLWVFSFYNVLWIHIC